MYGEDILVKTEGGKCIGRKVVLWKLMGRLMASAGMPLMMEVVSESVQALVNMSSAFCRKARVRD